MNPPELRISSINKEQPYECGKFITLQVLLDIQEIEALIDLLGSPYIFLVGGALPPDKSFLTKEQFLEGYREYIEPLKEGALPDEKYRNLFGSVWTKATDHLFAVPVGENRQLVRVYRPIIQLQSHSMSYSHHDGKFHPMVFGEESILWGIQFSYPQLFKDPVTKTVTKVTEDIEFPNTSLFHHLQKWVRHHTMATPFLVGGKQINVPVRIGKECLSWINHHPQLVAKKIEVKRYDNKES